MALAWWLEDQGVKGLLALMHQQAAFCIECGRNAHMVNTDEVLLRLLASALEKEDCRIGATELLEKAISTDPELFKHWNTKNVTQQLGLFGIKTKRAGSSRYYDATLNQLREIQNRYNMDLFMDEE